ncbi:hypothetical protein [Rhizobium sp. 1399]|jgi:hypothetical protein|uniref:hypothetical protein n=1 Tax=Rhizobium sp. 1399 TaxID=2817758 RepID=UPI002867576A|nr:hypothetical protein [Rhizobium sp. 1399]MDR6668846.1 hypothetical protein [Rhizobium sp. 1399]
MVDVIAIERGYFGGARREPGERFALPDALWKDEKRRPKWVRLARSGARAEAEPAEKKPAAKPAKPATPPEPIGNGVQEALGGPAPDWVAPEIQNSSQPGD